MKKIAYVGIDYHQPFLALVVLPEGAGNPVQRVKLENDSKKIKKYMKKLSVTYDLRTCYEASSCGYVFYRQMSDWGYCCQVIAPSKIPQKPGDHVKTDFKDAENLAYQFRNGSLASVHVPDADQEAVRALVRCRRALKEDSKRVKLRIHALLKTQGLHYARANWTKTHQAWLNQLDLSPRLEQVLNEYRIYLEYLNNRLADLDGEIETLAQAKPYSEPVRALSVLRGIGTLSAMTLICEIIDFNRFPTAKALMGYLGLTSSEFSSAHKQYGRITKAGNANCRRILVECVQHYRKSPKPTRFLVAKWNGQPPERVQTAIKCMQRLHKRYWALEKRKPKNVALVAIAREFAGFIWSLMRAAQENPQAA